MAINIFQQIALHKASCYSFSDCFIHIRVYGWGNAKSLFPGRAYRSLPVSVHLTASLWGWLKGCIGDKVSRIFRIWPGPGTGEHRVFTCQPRCQPSSACRKYNMIGAGPNIGMFSHGGCWLGKMSRRLLMTLACLQLCLREVKNGFVRWSIRTKMEKAEKRIEVKRSVDLPSPAAISILQFHSGKKKIW